MPVPVATCDLLPYSKVKGVCDRCGKKLTGKRRRWCSKTCTFAHTKNHRWTQARAAARRRDKYKCVTCGSKEQLEVNHIIPLNGRGYKWGCVHHLANLETLCHACHVVVTREQRAKRNATAGRVR